MISSKEDIGKITGGPSKFDLMTSLFTEHNKVMFQTENGSVDVTVTTITRLSDGQWIVRGRYFTKQKEYHKCEIVFSTKDRKGDFIDTEPPYDFEALDKYTDDELAEKKTSLKKFGQKRKEELDTYVSSLPTRERLIVEVCLIWEFACLCGGTPNRHQFHKELRSK